MRLIPKDPDLETITRRISTGELDLQPDFQRGEVWAQSKKRRLIDTVLREWHIPPIHVVLVEDTGVLEVLDGQQRLASIRDFVKGTFAVDGRTEPEDPKILALHGKRFGDLPDPIRKAFNRFTIRMYELVDYTPEEPGELFFRLNQQSTLNPAEQRNAFYGPTRRFVKDLVNEFEDIGITPDVLGFSNARMSYEDVVARVAFHLHSGSMADKVTAKKLEYVYRSQEGFSEQARSAVCRGTHLFAHALREAKQVHFNKATLSSWLMFFARNYWAECSTLDGAAIGPFLVLFETARQQVRAGSEDRSALGAFADGRGEARLVQELLALYNDRAAARSTTYPRYRFETWSLGCCGDSSSRESITV